MKRTSIFTTLSLLATVAAASVTPALADGWGYRNNNDQTSKNNMRNLTIAGAAVAAYGLFSHNSTATLLGAAGAVIAGSQYEKDRQQQSQDNHGYYYYRDGQNGDNRNQYNRNQYDQNRYDQNRYDRNGDYDSQYDQNGYRNQNQNDNQSQSNDQHRWNRH